MDPQTQASFIPKKPLMSRPPKHSSMGLLWIIAVVLFIVSAAAAGGSFAYQGYLKNQIASESNSLKEDQAAYDPDTIKNILNLSSQLSQAKELLDAHIAPSALFTYLEQNTLKSVHYTQFSYAHNADGTVTLSLSGEAPDFGTVALQSDALNATSTILKDVVFSGVNTDKKTGGVDFDVKANLDPASLAFSNTLSQANTPSAPESLAGSTTPPSAPAKAATSTQS